MSGNDYYLLGVFASSHVGHDVVSGGVGESVRRKHKMHADRAFGAQMRDEIRIFIGYRAGRNSGGGAVSGVGEAITGAADRAAQRRTRAESRSGFCAGTSVDDCFSVRIEREPACSFRAIKRDIEQNDLSGDFVASERSDLVYAVL